MPSESFLPMRRLSGFAACAAMLVLSAASARAELVSTIARVRPAVVMVGVFSKTGSPQFSVRGTGFAVADGRTVATAAHVVANVASPGGESAMLVIRSNTALPEQRTRIARVAAVDEVHDLAVLRIDGPPLPTLNLTDSEVVQEGRMVAFTGFPIGGALGFTPVTHRGMVSAVTPVALPSPTASSLKPAVVRRLKEGSFPILQLDATAYPGNSGGPMFDTETGEVLGIINMVVIKGTKEAALSHPSGISYAVPVVYLRSLLNGVGP